MPTSPLNDPAVDDQVEHPDQGTGAPLTLEAIREGIAVQLEAARRELADHREIRDRANALVKKTLAEVEELERVHNHLKPRPPVKRKPKTAPAD